MLSSAPRPVPRIAGPLHYVALGRVEANIKKRVETSIYSGLDEQVEMLDYCTLSELIATLRSISHTVSQYRAVVHDIDQRAEDMVREKLKRWANELMVKTNPCLKDRLMLEKVIGCKAMFRSVRPCSFELEDKMLGYWNQLEVLELQRRKAKISMQG